ncbi:MAG: UDP-N-acetylmuramate--L-alanine ligase [Candidatus Uhrbacteria bacterium]|nr:UDP-N-acetylmuramate--L-alanine ligase [Candidatus Uhrbacteria bacterium]
MVSLQSAQRIHFVGIKGAGVSGLACILKKRGKEVCGSDVDEEFFTDDLLRVHGIPCERFSFEHIEQSRLDMVIFSTAWKESDEVLTAQKKGIPALSYPEALGMLLDDSYGIAIAGSHGKTTTSGMLAHVLKAAGLDPTALVGSELSGYGTNAFAGLGKHVVIEADEYENKFQYYHPRAILLTNVDYDHPDYFETPAQYEKVFEDFIAKTLESGGTVVVCGDDEGVARVCHQSDSDRVVRYGMQKHFPYSVSHVEANGPSIHYSLMKQGVERGRYSLGLIGVHNVLNALGVIALCDSLGLVDAVRAAELLEGFQGTARRFEYKGKRGNMVVYDDFAHHPRELSATLEAARNAFPGKNIWCVFGSHTFSRTEALLDDFSTSFTAVTTALILDIYGSAREQQGNIRGGDLASAITAVSNNAKYVGTHEVAMREIINHIDEIDVLITMGAGDVWRIADELIRK